LIGLGSEQHCCRRWGQNFEDWSFNQSGHDPGMEIAMIIARVLLGLVFVVFGSNIFLHSIPKPRHRQR
jgi:hypothetical protein